MSLVNISRTAPPRASDSGDAFGVEDVWAALSEVMDPELGLPITELGLVYRVEATDGAVEVDITTTTPICPLGSFMSQDAKRRLRGQPGVRSVDISIVHTPRWTPKMMSDKAKEALGWCD